MIWVDYLIISIISFSITISLLRGFIKELLSLITWIYAFFISSKYYDHFIIYFINFDNPIIRNSIAIIILFISILIIGSIINYIINYLIERIGLSSINRILGLCFGAFRGVFIISIITLFFNNIIDLSNNENWNRSLLIPYIHDVTRWFLT